MWGTLVLRIEGSGFGGRWVVLGHGGLGLGGLEVFWWFARLNLDLFRVVLDFDVRGF